MNNEEREEQGEQRTVIARREWYVKNVCCSPMNIALTAPKENTRLNFEINFQGAVTCRNNDYDTPVPFDFCPWCGKKIVTNRV